MKSNQSDAIIPAPENGNFTEAQKDRIIEMAWEDRTPFEAIEFQFGLKEKEVIVFMRNNSKASSFKMWRKRMTGRSTKHEVLQQDDVLRFKCSRQRSTGNKIAKR
ncbi:MAG: TIGR03643 family protein [Pedobacter sp.]|nr:MAG: TIGR03643 family protein [Pedobacter sp.]